MVSWECEIVALLKNPLLTKVKHRVAEDNQ